MPKVLIHSNDYQYGQYLNNLVCQIGAPVDINVQNNCLIKPGNSFSQDGLLVVDCDSEKELAEIIGHKKFSNVSVLWVTNSSCKVKIKPSVKVFPRPLDAPGFVYSVFDWYRKKSQNNDFQPPKEPFVIGNNFNIRNLRKKIVKVAKSPVSVLVCGPTGTGKGVVALAIHNNSHQRDRTFLAINCASLPSSLLESELFGYKQGAFTGAWRDKSGLCDLAMEGTLFFDEISEISPYMQAKLLQVLQEKEYCPVGGERNKRLNSRTIAATNADLKEAMEKGRFRRDLYYRLAVVLLDIPLLRDRKEDICVLTQYFLDKFCNLYNKKNLSRPSNEFWELIEAYDWPGNVRELEGSIKTMVVTENEDMVREMLYKKIEKKPGCSGNNFFQKKPDLHMALKGKMSLKEITSSVASQAEEAHIRKVMVVTGGKKKIVADTLGISYKCLLKKLQNYGL